MARLARLMADTEVRTGHASDALWVTGMLALRGVFLCTAYYRKVREENADADAEAAHGLGWFVLFCYVLFWFVMFPAGARGSEWSHAYRAILLSILCG